MNKQVVVGIIVGGMVLTVLLYRVDLSQFGRTLFNVNPFLLVVGLSFKLLVMWLKAVRWSTAVRSVVSRPISHAFRACMIGFTGNILFPARLGELAKVYVLDKHNHVGRTLALTTLGITQLFDLMVLVATTFFLSFWVTADWAPDRLTLGLIGGLTGVILGFLVYVHSRSISYRRIGAYVLGFLPDWLGRRVRNCSHLFVSGIGVLRKGRELTQVLSATVAIWLLEVLAVLVMLLAFHIHATVGMAIVLTTALCLSFAFPVTPGNLGISQALSLVVLKNFGVTEVAALAYSVGSQGVTLLVITTIGSYFLYREGLSVRLVREAAGL